ncbi:MAG: hypothetical protein P1U38_14925 [Aeromicrobium sp.]|uniref:hypothetical protein n=1 Tax=Aeromicrobium sp. TaxID=1871063 RepID=UPI0025C2CA76|nr:hypothetical protein [Aeromicrobium sp.]MCK5892385.1 hypothetical protein [Aeromicrobium sp.]MDF1706059.1 hypothetical protein [Aeromicrobium sp.]
MPSTNPGAHDPSDVEAVKRHPPSGIRPDGTPKDPPPVPQTRRRSLVRRTTRRYLVLLGVAAVMVAVAVIGLAIGGDEETGRTVIFTGVGLIGALLALAATIWRGKVGDDLDEAKL